LRQVKKKGDEMDELPGVRVELRLKVDKEHPVVNMNEPLLPHDSPWWGSRTVQDLGRADAMRQAVMRRLGSCGHKRKEYGI
jgi:hypothetical protein